MLRADAEQNFGVCARFVAGAGVEFAEVFAGQHVGEDAGGRVDRVGQRDIQALTVGMAVVVQAESGSGTGGKRQAEGQGGDGYRQDEHPFHVKISFNSKVVMSLLCFLTTLMGTIAHFYRFVKV